MKILIVYALAGVGHRRAARALFDYLKENYNGCEVDIVDALEYSNPAFRFFYTNGYFFLSKYLPSIWKFMYYLTCEKDWYFITRKIRRMINFIHTKEFSFFLIKENPDVVISTHLLAGEVISDLKRRREINPRLINVITDFSVHPFWVDTGVDEYIVALDSTKRELIDLDIDSNKIKVLGIPIGLSFAMHQDKGAVQQRLGLRTGDFTVLIVTGTIGIGPIEDICDSLHNDVQLLVVCASNEKLFKRLKSKNYPFLKVFPVIGNMEELMSASDLILTKPGGLTVSESLSMDLPMVFFTEIPGQESKNADVLVDSDIAMRARRISAIRNIILDFKNNPGKLEQIRKSIAKIKKPTATRDICDEICKGYIRPAN